MIMIPGPSPGPLAAGGKLSGHGPGFKMARGPGSTQAPVTVEWQSRARAGGESRPQSSAGRRASPAASLRQSPARRGRACRALQVNLSASERDRAARARRRARGVYAIRKSFQELFWKCKSI